MAFNGEELCEIFSWLPGKSVFKLASVAKSCREFSSENFFIKKQSQNMVHKNDSAFFMQPNSFGLGQEAKFHVLPGEKTSTGVPNKSLDFLKKFARLVGSSNGLVCCKNISDNPIANELFICNPATQRWLSIPLPWKFQDPSQKKFDIVFQCNTGPSNEFPSDYFLMAVRGTNTEYWRSSSELICKIYSPAEEIWQEKGLIKVGTRSILVESFIYQKDICYFLSDFNVYESKESSFYQPYIVVFDPNEGSTSFLQVPEGARKNGSFDLNYLDMGIFKWGKGNQESICFVKLSKGAFTVWALEVGHKKSDSWIKILTVRTRAIMSWESNPKIYGFTVINGDSLLMATKGRVYRYSLTSHGRRNKAKKVCSNPYGNGYKLQFFPYSNTLRPCGDGETPIPE